MNGWGIAAIVTGAIVYGGFMFLCGAFVASAGYAGRQHDALAAAEAARIREQQAKLN